MFRLHNGLFIIGPSATGPLVVVNIVTKRKRNNHEFSIWPYSFNLPRISYCLRASRLFRVFYFEKKIKIQIACVDFTQGAVGPIEPVVEAVKPILRERLFICEHFGLWRHQGDSPFTVGAAVSPRALVCVAGNGQLEHDGANYAFGKGDVLLLPAIVGVCLCRTSGPIAMLEISLPEGMTL